MIAIRWFIITILLSGVHWAHAAGDSRLSQGSTLSATGASTIAAGSVEVIAGSSALTVKAVEASAKGAVVVLEGTSNAATVSLTVAPEIAAKLSKAIGSTVEVIAESAGYALMHAGQMIAFVPNEIGKSLLHHSQHPQ